MQLMYRGQRTFRILWGAFVTGLCIWSDKQYSLVAQKQIQVWIIAIGAVGILAIELGKIISPTKNALGLLTLAVSHALICYLFWDALPFRNGFSLMLISYGESLLVGIFYLLLSSRGSDRRVPPLLR